MGLRVRVGVRVEDYVLAVGEVARDGEQWQGAEARLERHGDGPQVEEGGEEASGRRDACPRRGSNV